MDYPLLDGSMSIDFKSGRVDKQAGAEDWIVHLKDTGLQTNTGGRLKRLEESLSDGTFMLTYGDGVCGVDFDELLKFHRSAWSYCNGHCRAPAGAFWRTGFQWRHGV